MLRFRTWTSLEARSGAVWWDIAGNPVGNVYPGKIYQPDAHPGIKRWYDEGAGLD